MLFRSGKEAIVISSKGTSIYCSTPESYFEGTVEIKIGEQTVIASEKYQYEPQMVVTDLYGDVDELGEGNIVDTGPFDDCGTVSYTHLIRKVGVRTLYRSP